MFTLREKSNFTQSKLLKMNSKRFYLLIICAIIGFSSCVKKEPLFEYNYGTQNDSAMYYFNKGWVAIMDHGKWMDSEKYYRKALEFDPDFVIGRSLIGRITQNLHERIAIQKELNSKITILKNEDEKSLLQVYLSSIRLMNVRGQGLKVTPEDAKNHYRISETHFRNFVKKHPKEDYVKAEYIEILHRNHGPKIALDSLYYLSNERQLKIPFYIYYKAELEAEMGNFEKALQTAEELKVALNDPSIPSQYMLLASIHYKMNELKKAKFMIEKVVALDPKHQIGQNLRKRIYDKLR